MMTFHSYLKSPEGILLPIWISTSAGHGRIKESWLRSRWVRPGALSDRQWAWYTYKLYGKTMGTSWENYGKSMGKPWVFKLTQRKPLVHFPHLVAGKKKLGLPDFPSKLSVAPEKRPVIPVAARLVASWPECWPWSRYPLSRLSSPGSTWIMDPRGFNHGKVRSVNEWNYQNYMKFYGIKRNYHKNNKYSNNIE